MTEPNERHCYCKPGDEFCGTCERCGAPGHTRHAPSQPYTGAWCDRCYGRLRWHWSTFLVGWRPYAIIAALVLLGRCVF